MNELLTDDTNAILLLCGVFDTYNVDEYPLTLREYNALAGTLFEKNKRPADLLNDKGLVEKMANSAGLDSARLRALLARGVKLGFMVEEWNRNGIWIISRSDKDYPSRYKSHLKKQAPPLLFGVGDKQLLDEGGVSVVGSRSIDEEALQFVQKAASICAEDGFCVISGGARGVDQTAMLAALEAGGKVVGVLAENLLRKSLDRECREAIAHQKLLLISPFHPKAGFSVGTAMARNKLIYALADYALVAQSDFQKGGTWDGATEELKRQDAIPLFVRIWDKAPKGNRELVALGAKPWPSFDVIQKDGLRTALSSEFKTQEHLLAPAVQPDLFDASNSSVYASSKSREKPVAIASREAAPQGYTPEAPGLSVYETVLPLILGALDVPKTAEALSAELDVNKAQMNIWLKKALEAKKVGKTKKPVMFQRLSPS